MCLVLNTGLAHGSYLVTDYMSCEGMGGGSHLIGFFFLNLVPLCQNQVNIRTL